MISLDHFEKSCRDFVSNQDVQLQGWKFCVVDGGGVYLNVVKRCDTRVEVNVKECEELEFEEHDPSAVAVSNTSVIEFDFHIAYHKIFKVPFLLLRATVDGIQLGQQDIIQHLSEGKDDWLPKELNHYTFLTQGEHPVLGTIYFYLHPCQTAELITTVTDRDFERIDYVAVWLSFFGRAVGLHVPMSSISNKKI
ncbi:autophagy-related protein ATG10 [Acrasis kona]|uniref:Ubiquitin-like-conjugating enzyme ATG10 n=1 Tax=Acrasis kona TaxID=1008807 RepID=A0AAW2YIS2_9EUKA